MPARISSVSMLPSMPLREALSDAAFYSWLFSSTYPLLVLLNKVVLAITVEHVAQHGKRKGAGDRGVQ